MSIQQTPSPKLMHLKSLQRYKRKRTISASNYLVGLGSYDITGPAADVNMMGYANSGQTASGVHIRLRARTFIVAEPQGNHVVFVNLDACMAEQLVTIKVLERLKARYFSLNS
ncbi:putative ceramidase [Helianthus anomalus]